jgi:hypothetical protein
MHLNIHPNEWVWYVFHLYYMVRSHRDQDGTRTSMVLDQPQEILSPESMISQKKGYYGKYTI